MSRMRPRGLSFSSSRLRTSGTPGGRSRSARRRRCPACAAASGVSGERTRGSSAAGGHDSDDAGVQDAARVERASHACREAVAAHARREVPAMLAPYRRRQSLDDDRRARRRRRIAADRSPVAPGSMTRTTPRATVAWASIPNAAAAGEHELCDTAPRAATAAPRRGRTEATGGSTSRERASTPPPTRRRRRRARRGRRDRRARPPRCPRGARAGTARRTSPSRSASGAFTSSSAHAASGSARSSLEELRRARRRRERDGDGRVDVRRAGEVAR